MSSQPEISVRRRWGLLGRRYEASFKIVLGYRLATVTVDSYLDAENAVHAAQTAYAEIRQYRS